VDQLTKQREFNIDIAKTFIEAGIPLGKLEHPAVKSFIMKWMKKNTPDRTNIARDYIEPIYDEKIEEIKKKIGDSAVNFQLDEMTDPCGRFVLNILVAPLNGSYQKRCYSIWDSLKKQTQDRAKRVHQSMYEIMGWKHRSRSSHRCDNRSNTLKTRFYCRLNLLSFPFYCPVLKPHFYSLMLKIFRIIVYSVLLSKYLVPRGAIKSSVGVYGFGV